jgi:hypothetical protein
MATNKLLSYTMIGVSTTIMGGVTYFQYTRRQDMLADPVF